LKILVTDGNSRAALAITRALGREGNQIIVGSTKLPSLASGSRYCTRSFIYPDPGRDSGGFVSKLRGVVAREKPDVLLPVTDITTLLVAENKTDFEKYCAVPFPEYESVRSAADKVHVMKLAEKLQIPVPATVYLHSRKDAETGVASLSSILGRPMVVKPAHSRVRTGNGWTSTGVRYAVDERHLREILCNGFSPVEYPLLLQERIKGDGVGLFLCMDRNGVIAAFCHRRLREKPPSGGVSVLRESIPMQPLLRVYAERLLRALGWYGIAMVEFKKDERAGDYKLMEINGRFWGSLQLAIDAGVNFPSLLVRMANGEKVVPLKDYQVGVKTRWLWGDVDALLSRLFKSDAALNLPNGHPGRLRSVIDFMKFWGKDLHYEVMDPHDLKPWLHETKCWLRGIK
jgi:predicted ATP-grasp superfamily ATP-dependent carboligase